MKRVLTYTTVAGLLFAAACSKEPPPPMYQAVPVSTRNIVVSASAAGVVEPVTTVDVKSKASGEIIEMTVETGDAVRAGQRLIRVDPRIPQNALTQAEADLEVARAQLTNAQAQMRRAEDLHRSQSITEQEYENARLATANANAQLVRAQRSLEDARIAFEDTDVRAPIGGVVIQKNVEVGTVISSAMSNVSGGTVLLQMADLDTVQVRALVDETDIGKVQPGLPVTITVDAFPNQPFRGEVLKIEPQAVVQQNVTMFPVLIRIGNERGLLRPGMNAEVEVHVGSREDVLAVPVAALRTQRDVESAALVLGLDPEEVSRQLAAVREGGRASLGGTTADTLPSAAPSNANVYRTPDGREVQLPPDITADQVRAVFAKMRDGGGPQNLSAPDRALLNRVRPLIGAGRTGPGGGNGARRQQQQANQVLFGARYIVFVLRNGAPTVVEIQTGLTDLDYAEVREGLSAQDTVLLLPSAGLVASLEEWRERMSSRAQLPGVQRSN